MVQYGCGGRRSRLADVVGGDDRLTGEPRSVGLGVVHLGDGAGIPARVEDASLKVTFMARTSMSGRGMSTAPLPNNLVSRARSLSSCRSVTRISVRLWSPWGVGVGMRGEPLAGVVDHRGARRVSP